MTPESIPQHRSSPPERLFRIQQGPLARLLLRWRPSFLAAVGRICLKYHLTREQRTYGGRSTSALADWQGPHIRRAALITLRRAILQSFPAAERRKRLRWLAAAARNATLRVSGWPLAVVN
jgi:hypothetical protein